MNLKNAVFWDVIPCGSCKNRRFGGTWRLHHQGDKNQCTRNNVSHTVFLRSVRQLLVTANIVPSSLIPVTVMREALRSSKTSVLTRATWYNIQEDGILHNHHM
jgi:hypothetical protein